MDDPTKRFSNRVAEYVRWRPRYPGALVETLSREHGLQPSHVIADIGSGTGILSELFLEHGNTVFGVEPNAEMRGAAESLLAGQKKFKSVAASAEATGLDASSVDWVTAGQAFHWFDADKAKREFKRILKPGGQVALIWNERRADTPFLREYELLLNEFGTDYAQVQHRDGTKDMRLEKFLSDLRLHRFDNGQSFDYEGLKGRLLSSSYAPQSGHPKHEPMLKALRKLFDKHAAKGVVEFKYDTHVYVGKV